MGKAKVDKLVLHNFILKNIEHFPNEIVKLTSAHFNISRQTVYRHIKELIENKHLIVNGEGRNKEYELIYSVGFLEFELSKRSV